jgi:hypothetical protein
MDLGTHMLCARFYPLEPGVTVGQICWPDLWARPVGQTCSRTHPLPSLCPAILTCQPSLTSCPRSPRRGRTHDRVFPGHVRAPAPLLSPTPCSPTTPLPFAPSAQLPRPLSLCPREPRAPPPPTDVHRLFRGCRCARAPSSATVSFALP